MPPKPKFTKEEIISAAYALLEQKGMDAVVAREVARELSSTPAPIFTCFENMEELKEAVHAKAISECTEYLRDCTDRVQGIRPAVGQTGAGASPCLP